MKFAPTLVASAAALAFSANLAHANLAGLALQYYAKYQGPSPAPNVGGTWTVGQPNTFNLGVPTWTDATNLHIPNVENRLNQKDLYFEIDYATGTRPAAAPAVTVTGNGAFPPYTVVAFPPVAGVDDWTYHWNIVTQPLSEDLHFQIPTIFLLQNGVIDLEVGSNCTPLPEPAAATAAVAAAGVLLGRRRTGNATRPSKNA